MVIERQRFDLVRKIPLLQLCSYLGIKTKKMSTDANKLRQNYTQTEQSLQFPIALTTLTVK